MTVEECAVLVCDWILSNGSEQEPITETVALGIGISDVNLVEQALTLLQSEGFLASFSPEDN